MFTCVGWQLTLCNPIFRVTTCLENLEMSGNLEHVREMSEKILSWKSVPKLFITR